MDVFQHSAAGLLPVIAKPDAALHPALTAPRRTDAGDPTFASVLQSQLQSRANATPHSSEGKASASREAEITDVAQQLESLLLYNLLKEMWATVPESTLLDSGMAGEFYREMWLEAVADEISQTGDGVGLADVLAADITRLSL